MSVAIESPPTQAAEVDRKQGAIPARRAFLLFAPVFALYAITLLYPIVRMLSSSVGGADPFGNYRTLLTDGLYVEALVRTFAYAAVATLGTLIIGYPLAYFLVRGRPLVRSILVVLVVVPFFVALLVRTFGWMLILAKNGPINRTLMALGLTDEPLALIYTPAAVILGMIAVLLPFMVLPLTTVMRSIDPKLKQAAHGLGAALPGAFIYVILPLSMPGVMAGSLLVYMLGLGFFVTPDLLGGSGEQVYPVLLNRSLQANLGDPAFSSAMSVVLLIAALVVLFVASRFVPISEIWSPRGRTGSESRSRRAGRRGEWVARAVAVVGSWPKWLYSLPGYGLTALGVLLCVLPMIAAVLMSFQRSIFAPFPSFDLTLDWYRQFAQESKWLDALLTSLQLGVVLAVLTSVISTLTALAIVRGDFPGKQAALGVVCAPLVIPHVALAFGLYLVLFQFRLDGTFWGVALGHSIPAIPLVTIILISNLASFDGRLEQAARGLGASPIKAFLKVTFPILRPGFLVAAFFGFLVSLDELVFTLSLAGTQIRTLPIRLWEDLHLSLSPMLAVVSVIEMIIVIAVLGASGGLLRGRRIRAGMESRII